ncbi:uncharacterized protein LOC6549376 [Drosophila erecta]|uniref:Uncharacterized protein n=1 Tax=Drosophila erecta TaxID=7220 RepID=B3NM96_DROER|nr:uncharacterized protein LOC6549376 [Drosophila erecta]EDV54696.1 uncharacterized protein Dere_GG21655 [Drosophila erecta]
MCFNVLAESNLLPDCSIANRVHLFSVLQHLQSQERRPEDVSDQLRDRYTVFRQLLPNYPVPELADHEMQGYFDEFSQEDQAISFCTDPASSDEETSESSLDSESEPEEIGQQKPT